MESWSGLDLPGFRFHPTEEELLNFYLKGAVHGHRLRPEIIRVLNLYRHDPRELPGMASIGEREWYFFVPRERRSSNGGRRSRTTERGFWKATGSDRRIRSVSEPNRLIGLKKTLVFYEGRAPCGTRTNWVMNEYRLPDGAAPGDTSSPPKEDMVLCKVYLKATSRKELERRAATDKGAHASASSSPEHDPSPHKPPAEAEAATKVEADVEEEAEVSSWAPGAEASGRKGNLPELEVPPRPAAGFDWTRDQDAFLRSPWPDHWSPYYAAVFNV